MPSRWKKAAPFVRQTRAPHELRELDFYGIAFKAARRLLGALGKASSRIYR